MFSGFRKYFDGFGQVPGFWFRWVPAGSGSELPAVSKVSEILGFDGVPKQSCRRHA